MKKYEKPMIMFDNFTLSKAVAGDCGVKTETFNSNAGCGVEYGRETVFMTGMNGCSIEVDPLPNGDAVWNDMLCYHVFSNDKVLFNS